MSATRRLQIADTMDELDRQIWDLQQSKKETYESYRVALAKDGMTAGDIKTEVEAVKKGIALRRKMIENPAAVDELDGRIDEVLHDIMPRVVTRGAHAPARAEKPEPRQAEKFDGDTGEIAEPAKGVAQTDGLDTAEVILCATHSPAEIAESLNALGAVAVPAGDTKFGALTSPAPYRITPSTPAPEPVDPDASPLIADPVARMAEARALLGQSAEAAE
jgi:hypothetical protein